MTPEAFIAKWSASGLGERAGAQEHFRDLCALLGEPTPSEADPAGETYAFERAMTQTTGRAGFADVWKRGHFAWEYKAPGADLEAAYAQLQRYAVALENPPLLIVSEMRRIHVHTNWTNTIRTIHRLELADLRVPSKRELLKHAFADTERLKPGITRRTLTEDAAQRFAGLALHLRNQGHDPHKVAHFVNRLVFCMFAEDVGLLPNKLFLRMLEHAEKRPAEFQAMAADLFRAMRTGSRIGFEQVNWFNGGLFDDDEALPLDAQSLNTALDAARLDWAEIDPSIFGTLFERGLDPDKRSQLGAHYTDREKIMLIVDPVIVRPLTREWEDVRRRVAKLLDKAKGRAPAQRTRAANEAQALVSGFLDRLRNFRVLDPACGSGNFLYLALLALKDLEHRVNLDAEALGLPRQFPAIGPEAVKGIEINPYAAELARVTVWIGEIQWMKRNGFDVSRSPVLRPLNTIECRDALLNKDGREADWPAADVIVGNPPFLGDKLHRRRLGDIYTEKLRAVYSGRVAGGANLVVFWIQKSQELLQSKRILRFGYVATKAITRGSSRKPLENIVASDDQTIFDAWTNEKWVVEGAAVRVSLVCAGQASDTWATVSRLNGRVVATIGPDLTEPLGFRLIHSQNARAVASATPERKLVASLS